MPIDVTWDNTQQTVCRWVFYGEWTWEDCLAADRYARNLTRDAQQNIHHILDLTHSASPPAGLLENFPRAEVISHVHQGYANPTIILGVHGFTERMTNILVNTYPNLGLAHSIEEAYTLIKKSKQVST